MHQLNYLYNVAEAKRVKAVIWAGLYTGTFTVPYNTVAENYLLNLFTGFMPNPEGIKNERACYV
jgi:hypothetical protein